LLLLLCPTHASMPLASRAPMPQQQTTRRESHSSDYIQLPPEDGIIEDVGLVTSVPVGGNDERAAESGLHSPDHVESEKQTFKDELIDAWANSPIVMEALEALKERCLEYSRGGKMEGTFKVNGWLNKRPDTEKALFDATKIRDALLEKVKLMRDFDEVKATNSDAIYTKWSGERRPKRPRLGNMCVECKICHTVAPLTAMRPCGHTVCHTCGDKLKEKCPFCRERIGECLPLFDS